MTYVWKCLACETETEIQRPMKDSQIPPEGCDFCNSQEGKWEKVMFAPNFTRRTFLDGMRTKSDQNFADAKRALQLEVDKARSNSESDKKEMNKEIKRLRSTKP